MYSDIMLEILLQFNAITSYVTTGIQNYAVSSLESTYLTSSNLLEAGLVIGGIAVLIYIFSKIAKYILILGIIIIIVALLLTYHVI